MIDLHTHSTASDGTLEPAELVNAAIAADLHAVALTDHDTVDGIQAFLDAPHPDSMTLVPGVEISAKWFNSAVHILGLGIDHTNPDLLALLQRIADARRERNAAILKRLRELKRPVEVADQAVICRSHIAWAMVKAGYVDEQQKAFRNYLGTGKPAFVQLELPMISQAIDAIHAAGGVAVWAHPTGMNRRPRSKVRQMCQFMMDYGLDGVETHYSYYFDVQHRFMVELADELGLLQSGGSDFHGERSPDVQLGKGKGKLAVPDSLLEPLLNS